MVEDRARGLGNEIPQQKLKQNVKLMCNFLRFPV